MRGMDGTSGRALSGEAHLAQSIGDILGTPKGTRIMRREFGSDVPGLIDAPLNGQTLVSLYAAIAEALDRWEPRVRLEQVAVVNVTEAGVEVQLSGVWTDRAADGGALIDGAHAQAGDTEVSL